MDTITGIIAQFGGPARLARRLNPPVPEQTVYAWRRRDSIPVAYWPRLIETSAGKITEADLLKVHLQGHGAAE